MSTNSNSHNADQAAHNAERVKRAQMAIEARRGAVGCGHAGDAVKRARKAVYAQKNGILGGGCCNTHNAEFLGNARGLGEVLIQAGHASCDGVLGDVLHAPMVCDISRHKKPLPALTGRGSPLSVA